MLLHLLVAPPQLSRLSTSRFLQPPLPVGSTVTALHYPLQILHRGTLLSPLTATGGYLVQFERPGLGVQPTERQDVRAHFTRGGSIVGSNKGSVQWVGVLEGCYSSSDLGQRRALSDAGGAVLPYGKLKGGMRGRVGRRLEWVGEVEGAIYAVEAVLEGMEVARAGREARDEVLRRGVRGGAREEGREREETLRWMNSVIRVAADRVEAGLQVRGVWEEQKAGARCEERVARRGAKRRCCMNNSSFATLLLVTATPF